MIALYDSSAKRHSRGHVIQSPQRLVKTTGGTILTHSPISNLPLPSKSHIHFKTPLMTPQGHQLVG